MSPFTVLVLCIQACLIQSVFGQSGCGGSLGLSRSRIISQPIISRSQASLGSIASAGSCGSSGIGSSNLLSYSAPIASTSYSISNSNSGYGGQGTGQVAAAGNIDASGNTAVTGSVPVLGQVSFSGTAPASGSVSISGQCGCGCS